MPLYEYSCKKCGHKFERLLKSYNDIVKECPVCGGEVERLISASAVQFKGSGFYSTDYGAKPSAKPASADGPAAASVSDGAASSSEKSAPAKTEAASTPAPASKPAAGS
jgi:putative FmdB family regulatory protein